MSASPVSSAGLPADTLPPAPSSELPMNDWQTDGWLAWTEPYQQGALLTLAALPIAVLVVGALARRRQLRGTATTQAWRLSLAEVGIVYGTLPFIWLTMLPGSQAGSVSGRVSLMPLRDLVTMPPPEVAGNLLVFAALGFFAPLRFSSLASAARIVALAATGSILIETAQYVLRLDRVSSIDDVLLNTAGALAAALASHRWWLVRRASPGVSRSPLDTNPALPAPASRGSLPRL